MSLKTNFRFTKIKIDKGRFSKSLDEAMKREVRLAAKEWVRAVWVRVPVWTGQARGAIKWAKGRSGDSSGLFLSEYLNVAIPIDEYIVESKNENGRPKTQYVGGIQSRFTFGSQRGVYSFTWQTDIDYFEYLDQNPGRSPTSPWEAIKAGNDAFIQYMRENLINKVPKISDFTIKEIISGGTN